MPIAFMSVRGASVTPPLRTNWQGSWKVVLPVPAFSSFSRPACELVRQEFGDMAHLEGQRLAVQIRRLPAQGGVGMTAFGDQQDLGLAGDGLIDQRAG